MAALGDNEGMRTALAPAITVAVLLALAGCTPVPAPSATSSASPSSSPSGSSSPSASPSSDPDEAPDLPVPTCEELVSPEAMYDYNSNVALTPDYTPPAGGMVARVAETGVSCGWVNLSSGEVIAIAIGVPTPSSRDAFAAEFSGWGAEQWGGTAGYFGVIGGEGSAAVISDGYVIVSVSSTYLESGDAAPIVEAALSSI